MSTSEAARLAFMRQCKIDRGDEIFGLVTNLAERLFGVEASFVALAAEADRLWISSCDGTPARWAPRRPADCPAAAHATVWVEDLRLLPPEAAADYLDPAWRFYASAALRLPSGIVLGVLAVASKTPRSPEAGLLEGLERLAALAGHEAERVAAVRELAAVRDEAQVGAGRLKLALDAAQAAAFEIDFHRRRFWASPEFTRIWGCSLHLEELLAGIWDGMHPDDRPAFLARRGQWGLRGNEYLDVRTLAHGDERWVRIYYDARRDAQGKPTIGVGLVQDIDRTKRQELELVSARAAAEAATEAKSSFLASVSHEIRTPMNGIVGVLHLLKAERISDEAQRLLDEALACSGMLGQLINDVLDLSKIEAGKLELSYEPTDPAACVTALLALLRPQAEAKGIQLNAEIAPDLGWVETDPVRLRQCLFNLVGNAVKFTTEGSVTVRVKSKPAGRLRVEVSDTGPGLGADVQARLFRRFEQAEQAVARQHGGTGLGLAITKTLVGLMDGEVGVESALGRGATFWFEIAAAPCVRATGEAPVQAGTLDGVRILLVDDNAVNRLVGAKILEALGAQVVCGEDGAFGVEAVKIGGFDCVLMDINMPGMDGCEATRIIRALKTPAANTPIIALTADVMAHQLRAYRAAGMNGVVAKPLSPANLLAEIVRLLAEEGSDLVDAAAAGGR